jgi:hypothetical protein
MRYSGKKNNKESEDQTLAGRPADVLLRRSHTGLADNILVMQVDKLARHSAQVNQLY